MPLENILKRKTEPSSSVFLLLLLGVTLIAHRHPDPHAAPRITAQSRDLLIEVVSGLLRRDLFPAGPLTIPSPIVPEIGIVAAHAPQRLFAIIFPVVFHEKVGRPSVLRTLDLAFNPSRRVFH
jgi:hypothetical protein